MKMYNFKNKKLFENWQSISLIFFLYISLKVTIYIKKKLFFPFHKKNTPITCKLKTLIRMENFYLYIWLGEPRIKEILIFFLTISQLFTSGDLNLNFLGESIKNSCLNFSLIDRGI